MMRTDELIASLAADPRPVRNATSRIAWALAVGALLALAGLVIALGSPVGPIEARGLFASALKVAYPLCVSLIAAAAAIAAGRPGARIGPRAAWFALPILYVSILAVVDLAAAPPAAWGGMATGTTYTLCLLAVMLGALPALMALIWAFRALAPTRLPSAGFLIGLAAGGASAVAYALYCPETSPVFLLAAYTPAMLIPAFAGAAVAKQLLRW